LFSSRWASSASVKRGDAERFRELVGRASERSAASTSRMGRFETEVVTQLENIAPNGDGKLWINC